MRGLILFALLMAACLTRSISANNAPSGNAAADSAPQLKNVKVLPKDSTYTDVVLAMNSYSRELGVQCSFCHAQDAKTQAIDFASDQSPAKLVARVMIGMVRDINEKYLAQVNDRRYASPITCGNCHQGRTFPPAYESGPGQ